MTTSGAETHIRITNWSQAARGYGLRARGLTVPHASVGTPSDVFRLSMVGIPRTPLGALPRASLIAVALPSHNPPSLVTSCVAALRRYGLISKRPAAIPLTSDASPPAYAGRLVLRRAIPPASPVARAGESPSLFMRALQRVGSGQCARRPSHPGRFHSAEGWPLGAQVGGSVQAAHLRNRPTLTVRTGGTISSRRFPAEARCFR